MTVYRTWPETKEEEELMLDYCPRCLRSPIDCTCEARASFLSNFCLQLLCAASGHK